MQDSEVDSIGKMYEWKGIVKANKPAFHIGDVPLFTGLPPEEIDDQDMKIEDFDNPEGAQSADKNPNNTNKDVSKDETDPGHPN